MYRRLFVFVTVLLALFDSRAARAQAPDLEDLLQQGKTQFEKGQLLDAMRSYEAAYKQKKIPAVALSIGLLNNKLKRGDAAQRWCTQAIQPGGAAELKAKAEQCLKEARSLIAQSPHPAKPSAGRPVAPPPVKPPPREPQTTVAAAAPSPSIPQPASPTLPVAAVEPGKAALLPAPASVLPTPTPPSTPTEPGPTATPAVVATKPDVAAPQRPSLSSQGSASVPLVPPTAEGSAKPPVYKRWWFWTIIGVGVAGAAAGITAGVLLNQKPADPFTQIPESNRRSLAF